MFYAKSVRVALSYLYTVRPRVRTPAVVPISCQPRFRQSMSSSSPRKPDFLPRADHPLFLVDTATGSQVFLLPLRRMSVCLSVCLSVSHHQCSVLDRRLPPRLNWILPSSGLLRGVSLKPTFRDYISVPSSWIVWLLKKEPIGCPETLVLNQLTA